MKPLPHSVEQLLTTHHASPRLRAHLTLVHDVAVSLTEGISIAWPRIAYDPETILFGAASHDIGKIIHPEELQQPGHAHEEAGERFLIENGIDERLARFARTHGQWRERKSDLEDLLVALADKIWKGKRDEELEQAVADILAARSSEEVWQVWMHLDDLLTGLAAKADYRLSWQARYPV